MGAVRKALAVNETHGQAPAQIRPLQVQDTRQPVAHENVKPIARGVAAPAHEFVEMPATRVTKLRLRLQPNRVAGGEVETEKLRNLVANGFGDKPRHELRVPFQAGSELGENGGSVAARPPCLGCSSAL